jgi:serine/threonine protein kinase
MTNKSLARVEWIHQQALRFGNQSLPTRPVVLDDTTDFMSIDRDHIIDLQGVLYLVRCNEREGRFGMEDQPKFWVKRALDLDSGQMHILKLVFQEEFKIRVGSLQVKCVRSAEKEGRVLELVRGDRRFMQGRTARDSRGNLVRVIDFISGVDLLSYLHSIRLPHEEYAVALLPGILARIRESCGGIQRLHNAGLCHGDIRNDHLLIERDTGCYKWIDFDLNEDFSDFDVWSVGNILHCVVAKGFVSFSDALRLQPELSGQLSEEDASVFFPHRVMNLRRVYPYLPAKLNEVLLRFSFGARACYDRVSQIIDDLSDCAESMDWKWGRI